VRSIRFLLFGKANSIEDCLYLSHRQTLKAVNISLCPQENVTGLYLIKRLKGIFVWDFEKGKVTVRKIFGGFLCDDCKKSQKKGIDNANRMLLFVVHKIEDLHIQVHGKDLRFKNSLIYKERT
jgi:hypothetical protein